MTYGACSPSDFAPLPSSARAAQPLSPSILCGAALALTTGIGLWALYGHQVPSVAEAPSPAALVAAAPSLSLVPELPAAVPALRRAVVAIRAAVPKPVVFAQSAALRANFKPAHVAAPQVATPAPAAEMQMAALTPALPEAPPALRAPTPDVVPAPPESDIEAEVPLPTPRPAFPVLPHTAPARVAATAQDAITTVAPAPAAAPADRPGFFDKIFNLPKPTSPVLAYAAPEDGGIASAIPGRATGTAIYEIATHTVHMPDGSTLEAHSGLGPYLDNPRGVSVRMRGPTPPNVYDLTLRESLFHGVQALRLTPVGGGTTYGRGGLLAHTFMLGPRGDSNGCVVFRNYRAFLAAYSAGQVRRLVVVERL